MYKKSWPGLNISLQCYKILVLLLLVVNKAESNICQDNKPCQGHGGCFVIEETSQPSFVSTKCVCARGYSGRWCQFQEDGIKLDYKQLKAHPGSPKIISQLSAIFYERLFNLTWKKPSETPTTPILYYALRYRRVGESKWKNVKEILASKTQNTSSYVFQSLSWDINYEVEIYAVSSQGVSRPAKGIIRLPKIEYPEFTYISKDKTGDDTILKNTPFHLRCEVRGQPRPTLSWLLNSYNLSKMFSPRSFSIVDGNLTVFRAYEEHEGGYRCVARNRWGTVLSKRVIVSVTVPMKFSPSNAPTVLTQRSVIGKPSIFRCPRHRRIFSGISYTWGNRYKNSSNDFDIETSERVWITTDGDLVFGVFKQQDADFINKKGIRCIIEQKTFSGRTTIMSNAFRVIREKPVQSKWFSFLDRPPNDITALRGESLELTCSALGVNIGLEGNVYIQWFINNFEIRFRNGVNVTEFGRVLKYSNVQKSDSGKISCYVYKLDRDSITGRFYLSPHTVTNLKVLDKPEDVYENPPRILSIYSSSILRLGQFHSHNRIWYFNGRLLKDKDPVFDIHVGALYRKSYLELDSDHFRSTTENSGVYQIELRFGRMWYIALTVYVHFMDEEALDETIPPKSGVQLYCVPPTTYSLPDISVKFTPSCGSKVAKNTFTITQETAWKDGLCSCKAVGDLYSVERKFDLDFDGAMFSSMPWDEWVWSQWSPWSHCPHFQELCGRNIFSTRHRECYNSTPSLDGYYCSGSHKQKQPCPFIPCPKKVPSFWAQWSIWSHCSNPCGPGTQSRRRMCVAPSEHPCPEGDWHETKKCVGSVCFNVEGDWSKWSHWSKCSKSCGVGSHMRKRHCSEQRCLGTSKEHTRCSTKCEHSKEDQKSLSREIYSKGIFYLPNMVALGTAIFLIGLGIAMAVHRCRKKSVKKSKHKRLLQDLFNKPDLDVERQPLLERETRPPPPKKRPPSRERKQEHMTTQKRTEPKNVARFKHKTDSKFKGKRTSPPEGSSSSLAPVTPPGNLPPPSPSLLAASGGIAPAPSAGGMIPPPPAVRGVVGPLTSAPSGDAAPPPPPPPPPAPKR